MICFFAVVVVVAVILSFNSVRLLSAYTCSVELSMESRERRPLSKDAVSASPSEARLRCGRRNRNITSNARKKANAPKAGYTTPLNWLAVGNALMMYTRSVGRARCKIVVIVAPAAVAIAFVVVVVAAAAGSISTFRGNRLGFVQRLVAAAADSSRCVSTLSFSERRIRPVSYKQNG